MLTGFFVIMGIDQFLSGDFVSTELALWSLGLVFFIARLGGFALLFSSLEMDLDRWKQLQIRI
jgi:hypothetical protein